MLRVGFIGLGKMGKLMAEHLLRAGFPLTVHNRSRRVVDELAEAGATPAVNPAEVAAQSDAILTCLPDVPAVEEVFLGRSGIFEACRDGHLLIDHSTVGPDTSRTLYERAQAANADFLDAPVSGGPAGAQAASLTIMAGGDTAAFQLALPLFETLGKNIHHVGPSGSGTIIKLANQLLVAIYTLAAAEAVTLTAKAGADPQTALEVLGTSFGSSAMLNRHGPLFLERRFDPGTPVELILKDLRLIGTLAEESGVRLLMGNLARNLFGEASMMGLGDRDMSVLIQPLERLAGMELGGR